MKRKARKKTKKQKRNKQSKKDGEIVRWVFFRN